MKLKEKLKLKNTKVKTNFIIKAKKGSNNFYIYIKQINIILKAIIKFIQYIKIVKYVKISKYIKIIKKQIFRYHTF